LEKQGRKEKRGKVKGGRADAERRMSDVERGRLKHEIRKTITDESG